MPMPSICPEAIPNCIWKGLAAQTNSGRAMRAAAGNNVLIFGECGGLYDARPFDYFI